jgi:chaperonin GroEL
MRFDRGFISPYFVTDPEKMEAVLDDPLVLIHDGRIAILSDLVPLLVIAEDVEGEGLATLVVNHMCAVLRCCAVKAPGFGNRRKAMLQDIAVLTGAEMISKDLGSKLEHVPLNQLGRTGRIVIDKDSTTIVGGRGERAAIDGRIAQIRAEIERSDSDYDREKLEERLARLAGGVAVIRVGAPSESELKARKEAFDDAISATRAAVAEGVGPGGGLALLRCAPALDAEIDRAEGDRRTGLQILRRALEAPARQIAANSAMDGGVAVARMLEGNGAVGLDAAAGRYVDLIEAGVLDPVKVVRVALENAASTAGLLLLSEATMTDLPEPKQGHDDALGALPV